MPPCFTAGVDKLLFALWVAVILAVAILAEYVCGRVILPAVGLTAPGFWTWFWFTAWAAGFTALIKFIEELMD